MIRFLFLVPVVRGHSSADTEQFWKAGGVEDRPPVSHGHDQRVGWNPEKWVVFNITIIGNRWGFFSEFYLKLLVHALFSQRNILKEQRNEK